MPVCWGRLHYAFRMEPQLILVDERDQQVGFGSKLEVHQKGWLHRAFSILIFNTKGQMLIQRRAKNKYHSGGLWTNACCSHPLASIGQDEILKLRLKEEIGLETNLEFLYKFIYKAAFENGLTEYELDYVYQGITDKQPSLNPDEADAYTYMSVTEINEQIAKKPEDFTVWFKLIMQNYPNTK
jgi:isopentenyl-diphosphate Delta-isomerase